MILVDIYIPSVDQTWDLMIDENLPVSEVIPELVRMAERKTHGEGDLDADNFNLYSMTSEHELYAYDTLAANGVRDGHRLMLL